MQTLDIRQIPLHGLRLIEASAGTGKTYAIANLYLRILLERAGDVSRILVVTFTRAATEELKGRIRSILQDALSSLDGAVEADPLICDLLKAHGDSAAARTILNAALLNLDEAAIFTIHGFCQRVLQELAIESTAPLDAVFLESEAELLQAVVEDFWRRELYPPGARGLAEQVAKQFATPDALLQTIRPFLARGLELQPHIPPEAIADENYHAVRNALIALWNREAAVIRELLATDKALSRAKDAYKAERVDAALTALEAFIAAPESAFALPEPGFELFFPSTLDAAVSDAKRKNGLKPSSHPFFDRCAELAQVCRLRLVRFLQQAIETVQAELIAGKRARGELAFDDLIRQLDEALGGPGGDTLAERLAERYPVALIDEFQDTDASQYAIFSRIYRPRPTTALFMIGDPKQAIYAFRGGDIFTYLQARQETDAAAGHFTLDTNWRASTALVRAVNAVFERSAAAFLYPGEIDFHPVRAAGRTDREPLRLEGKSAAALQIAFLTKTEALATRGKLENPIAKSKSQPLIARAVAERIARMLAGAARIGEREVRPADIAILVRDRFEAAVIRAALRERGIVSVFISQDSVFETFEAGELQTLLAAVGDPLDARLLRAALAGDLIGWSAAEIVELDRDEAAFEHCRARFLDLQAIWLKQGFMAMFQDFLRSFGVAERLLREASGDRRLTDLLHLAELLQQQWSGQRSAPALAQWLIEQRTSADGSAEGQQLRLESDENLVQVVTIHKSKGLEYPIVFLPYVGESRARKAAAAVFYHRSEDRRPLLDCDPAVDGESNLAAAHEQLAEDLRLLYVALTRAKHHCWLAFGDIGDTRSGALAYLLTGARADDVTEPAFDDALLQSALAALVESAPAEIAIETLNPACADSDPGAVAQRAQAVTLAARTLQATIDRSWRVNSFTGLSTHRDDERSERPDYDGLADADPAGSRAIDTPDRFGFPRGERAGRLLHRLLETADFRTLTPTEHLRAAEEALRLFGFPTAPWTSILSAWFGEILQTPLDDKGLRLADIAPDRRLAELEFHYPLRRILTSRQLNAILEGLADFRPDSPQLRFDPTRGVLKGSIDLVFEHAGRYFLADYKSNHLGRQSEDYRRDRLADAMNAHRYDLQYLLYSLALHRHLTLRLPDYDYERHFGGVYYLFLRGMHPETGCGAGVYFTRPSAELIARLDGAFGPPPESLS